MSLSGREGWRMVCPFCNAKARVIDTNPVSYTNYRKRLCMACGRSFYTKEICIQESEGKRRLAEKWQKWQEKRKNKLKCSENETM